MAAIVKIGAKWRAQVRKAGRKSISRTFDTKIEAQRWAMEIECSPGQATDLTVAALIQKYRDLRRDSGRPVKDQSNEDYMLRHLADADLGLGPIKMERLGTSDLVAWCQRRKKDNVGPYTINMHMSKLGTAIKHTKSVLGLRLGDPVGDARPTLHHFGLIGPGKKRDRRPTAKELEALFTYFAAHFPYMVDVLTVALHTGLRQGEIFRIRWADLDSKRRIIVVRDRKHPKQKIGNDQEVPLLGEAWPAVDRQPRDTVDGRIFPYRAPTVSQLFTRTCRDLGIQDLHFHDMRHEAVSSLFEAGWQIPEVAAVSGHKDWRQLKRYTQIDPAGLHSKVLPLRKAAA
ncbi:integrase [Bordetella genomosp. 9]|uniref:Integrase n=1 Tax=Bordetella genomosp. 9 TaxID=1416803 RepID=A0A261RQF4_9BORD|nr:site-specific integrase [Bordetella genomosp. 9]OZI26830.1 integrase [Bordetella genomosp. 9]